MYFNFDRDDKKISIIKNYKYIVVTKLHVKQKIDGWYVRLLSSSAFHDQRVIWQLKKNK